MNDIEVIVLEDNETDREAIQNKLIEYGIHPHFIYSRSKDLIEMLSCGPYVLVMDFYLVGENLVDDNIIYKVKELCEDCYTIVISSQSSERNFIALLNANANHYVKKTLSPEWLDILVAAIKKGRQIVEDRIKVKIERAEIERDLEEVRRKLNERLNRK